MKLIAWVMTGLLGILLAGQAFAADPSWTGSWDTRWREGGARMTLQEQDGKVTGVYPAYGGRIEGELHGRQLTGRWIQEDQKGVFDFVLAPDGQSFMGRFGNGEWWTGGRIAGDSAGAAMDQDGPRQALRTFVEAGNTARQNQPDVWSTAVQVMDFGDAGSTLAPVQRIEAAQRLFELVDQTTFRLWSVPGAQAAGELVPVTLTQAGTGASLPLTFLKKDGKWFIGNPPPATAAAARTALLARSGGHLPAADRYKLRRSARDALKSFLNGFSDWAGEGRDQTLGSLDLSELAPAVRDYEGELAAQYIRQVLDRVGSAIPQEVPDDPAGRDEYLSFSHPAGNIVIAPVGAGDQVDWKIDSDSVRTARDLYISVEDMPRLEGSTALPPPSAYFRLRQWIRDHLPTLLGTVGELEVWQALAWASVLVVSGLLAVVLSVALLVGVRLAVGGARPTAQRDLRWPLWMALTFSIYKLIIPVVGLPELSKRISVGTTGVLLALALMWLGWRLADLVADLFFRRSDAGLATMDNIVVSLAFGAVKLALLAGGFVFIAIELSLPYEGVIAGLSIGGLAVAFASRETISNIFGAGVLAIDRPFRRGDWIIAGDTQGSVEAVGIRSTRIRTGQDSLVTVPNGKLSDATVNNLGTRRYLVTKSKIPLCYGASADQIEAFTKGVKDMIAEVPQALPDRGGVSLSALGPEKIDVEYTVCFDSRTVKGEGAIMSQLMLDILRLGERIGIAIGQPSVART